MVGEELDAGLRRRRPAEALLEIGEEVRHRPLAVVEALREVDEPRQIGLAHALLLAELLRRRREQPSRRRRLARCSRRPTADCEPLSRA